MEANRKDVSMRVAYFGAAIAAAAIAAGCGGGDDNGSDQGGAEKAVTAQVAAFANAGREGNGDLICTQVFAPALAENVRRAAKQSCAAEVEDNLPSGKYELKVDSVEVKGDNADVQVTDQAGHTSVMHFIKIEKEWRVIRITKA